MSHQEPPKAEDLKQSLGQLGRETTAADLVRAKGQTRKVRVVSESQLMGWILKLLQQQLAGKADAFSDSEKEELLQKTQDELTRRIKREQELASERDKARQEIDALMARLARQGAVADGDGDVLNDLKRQLDEREKLVQDLQADNDDLRDQLGEKIGLLSTTIAEKDKLRDTVRSQMVRTSGLIEGVLNLDAIYYGSLHQNGNPVSESASAEEQFYHDFDVGAQIVSTLATDLERMHAIARTGPVPAMSDEQGAVMAHNLALLEQMTAGSLHAVDVADPVASLVAALEGARDEAMAFSGAIAEALGGAPGQNAAFTELPEPGGDPAETLASSTSVVRELGRELARGRTRIQGLKQMADEADAARQAAEAEMDDLRQAGDALVTTIVARAAATGATIPAEVVDTAQPLPVRCKAASTVVETFSPT
jgi:ABC-type transporter Mla subunit MlaD